MVATPRGPPEIARRWILALSRTDPFGHASLMSVFGMILDIWTVALDRLTRFDRLRTTQRP